MTLQTSLPITENRSGELLLSRLVWTTSGSFHIFGSCSYILKLITISVSLTADIPVKLRVRVDIFTSCRPFSTTQDPQCNQGVRGVARDQPRGATEHIKLQALVRRTQKLSKQKEKWSSCRNSREKLGPGVSKQHKGGLGRRWRNCVENGRCFRQLLLSSRVKDCAQPCEVWVLLTWVFLLDS